MSTAKRLEMPGQLPNSRKRSRPLQRRMNGWTDCSRHSNPQAVLDELGYFERNLARMQYGADAHRGLWLIR